MSDNENETLQLKETPRELETLPVEINIVSLIDNYIDSLVENNQETIEYSESSLVEHMVRYIKDWQFMYEGKQGLNSGSVGEAMAHLVGSDILKDFPVFREAKNKDRKKEPIIVEKKPTKDNENCIFKLNLIFSKEEKKYFTELLFDTNKLQVNDRLLHLRKQHELMRKAYSQKI